jgi:hypothetical protein
MQPDIPESEILAVAMNVIEEVRKHTSDAVTASKILNAADAAFGGGFTLDLRSRLEAGLSPSEFAEVPSRSPSAP